MGRGHTIAMRYSNIPTRENSEHRVEAKDRTAAVTVGRTTKTIVGRGTRHANQDIAAIIGDTGTGAVTGAVTGDHRKICTRKASVNVDHYLRASRHVGAYLGQRAHGAHRRRQ